MQAMSNRLLSSQVNIIVQRVVVDRPQWMCVHRFGPVVGRNSAQRNRRTKRSSMINEAQNNRSEDHLI